MLDLLDDEDESSFPWYNDGREGYKKRMTMMMREEKSERKKKRVKEEDEQGKR